MAARTGFVRDAFPGNQLPAEPDRSQCDQAAATRTPAPNQPGLLNNYVVNRTNSDDTHAFDVRVDHNFSSNDRFFARYSFSNNHKVRPSPFEGDGDGGGFSEGDEKVRRQRLRGQPHARAVADAGQRGALRRRPRAHLPAAAERRRHERSARDATASLGIPQLAGNGGLPLLSIRQTSVIWATPAGW